MMVNNTNNTGVNANVKLRSMRSMLVLLGAISGQRTQSTKKLDIFNIYKKNNYKLIPFNVRTSDLASTKYLPPVSKEWKNSIYAFNSNKLKNFPIYDININHVIKSYFKSYFLPKYIKGRHISRYFRLRRMNIVHVSKAEIKHTNSKAILNIFTYNREKVSLWKKISRLKSQFFVGLYQSITVSKYLSSKIALFYNKKRTFDERASLAHKNRIKRLVKRLRYKLIYKRTKWNKNWALFSRYKLKFNLNKYKFQERFLYYLSTVVSKYYKKKVEFNFINLKSVIFNSDIFTKALAITLRKRGGKVFKLMRVIFNKTKIPKIKKRMAKYEILANIDKNALENRYKNTSLNYILKGAISAAEEKPEPELPELDKLLYKIYYNLDKASHASHAPISPDKYLCKIYDIIFNSIKYKNIGGIRLVVAGRLTLRYRADKAVYKNKWKGKLNNLEASFNGLSCVNLRGYLESNIEYSMYVSKRRIGAFAVKGWISGI